MTLTAFLHALWLIRRAHRDVEAAKRLRARADARSARADRAIHALARLTGR